MHHEFSERECFRFRWLQHRGGDGFSDWSFSCWETEMTIPFEVDWHWLPGQKSQ
jgi:hypothetical protein